MAKQLIILGAGVSYGLDNYDFTPPLGVDLFYALFKFNPPAKTISKAGFCL